MVPHPGRDAGGRRRYTENDVHLLEVLLHLRDTGMPLAQVAQFTAWVAQDPGGVAERLALLTAHREDVLAQRRRVDASLAVIDRKIATYTPLLAASAAPAPGWAPGG